MRRRLQWIAGLALLFMAWGLLGAAGAQGPDAETMDLNRQIEELQQQLTITNQVVTEMESTLPSIARMKADNVRLRQQIAALQSPAFRRAVAFIEAGNRLYRQRLCSRAVVQYDAALGLFPTMVVARNNRGVAYLASGRARKALEDFDWVVAYGDEALWHYNRGMAHQELGHVPQAQADFREAAKRGMSF